MINLGIDLGTTFSLVSYVNPHGIPALFPDYHDANEFRTPSVVHIGEEGCLVGGPLEELLEDLPEMPHQRFMKLSMGTEERPYTDHLGRQWPPEALSALVLKKMLRDVETFANEDVGSVALAVPANFGDAERRATKNAAALAGLRDVILVEEPVAAATFYGLSNTSREETLFVYDLGGGTFDATVLQASPDGLFALATEGSNDIGGKDVDEIIMNQVALEYHRQHGIDPRSDQESATLLRRFATETKLKLAKPGRGQVRKTLLLGGQPMDFLISRSQFEDLLEPLVERTLEVSERCLASAGLSWPMIDQVLLTGGSSLLPSVTDRLRIVTGKPASQLVTKQPHQAVAYGAAILADQDFKKKQGNEEDRFLYRQISSFDLGLRTLDKATGRPSVEVLIRKNTALPATHTSTFYTTRPDQRRLIIEVVQSKGEEETVRGLGHFAFGPLANPRKNYPVEVTLEYDDEGIVQVTARDPETGQVIEQTLVGESTDNIGSFNDERDWIRGLSVNQ